MEKCHKCGNKLSYLDVLCPHCCAMVEKVPDQNDVLENHGDKSTGVSERSDGHEIHQRIPKPSSFRLYSPSQIRAAQASRNTSFNSYAESKVEQPKHGGRSRSELHGASQDKDTIVIIEDMPWHHKENDEPDDNQPASDTETSEKNWLEITEADEAIPRRYNGPHEPFEATRTDDSDDSDMPAYRYRSEKRQAAQSDNDEQSSSTNIDEQKKKRPIVLTAVFWLLAAATLFGVFYMLDRYISTSFGSYPVFIREITGGRIDLDTDAALTDSIQIAIDETTTADGAPAHSFDIHAFSAKQVRILPVDESFAMKNGRAQFVISDEALAQASGIATSEARFTAENITLIISVGEREITKDVGPVTLNLTGAAYTRHMPKQVISATAEDSVTISITVSQDAAVYINNTNYTEKIDPNGALSVTFPLTDGENAFLIDVRQMGHQTTKDSLTVIRESPEEE